MHAQQGVLGSPLGCRPMPTSSTGSGWLELKVAGQAGIPTWKRVWIELKYDISPDDEVDCPKPRPSDPKPKSGKVELQVYEFSQEKVAVAKAQALDRLQQLEGEFEAFKKNNSHDINEEEYQMIETSFQKRIRREKDYWEQMEAMSVPMRTFMLESGDYLTAIVTSRNSDTFKVTNNRKEMVFRTTGTAQRDIWLNRFALGQISHRIMTNTGTSSCEKGGEIINWPKDPSGLETPQERGKPKVDPREKKQFGARYRVLEEDFKFLDRAHDPVHEIVEVVDLFADVAKDEDALNLPVSAAGPNSEAQAAGIVRVPPDSKVSQTGSSASPKNPSSEDAKLSDKDDVAALDLFWQRRSLYEVPAQLWKNPTYAGVKGLFLDRNSITTLPAEMAALKHIKMLSIADNLLTDLPDWLDAFPCLDTLAVPRNKIRKVPEVIGTLHLLKNLNVFGNEIERIPIRMANCSALTTLNLRNNPLQPLKDVEEKNLLATVVAIPANLIQLIVGGRNDDALKLLKKFWQQRLDGYYGELKRLEETREEREREAERVRKEEIELGWKRDLLAKGTKTVDSDQGLRWKEVGLEKPESGTEMENAKLSAALLAGYNAALQTALITRSAFEGIVMFSRAEFDEFNVFNLSDQCYIRGGNFYFKPHKLEEKEGGKIGGKVMSVGLMRAMGEEGQTADVYGKENKEREKGFLNR